MGSRITPEFSKTGSYPGKPPLVNLPSRPGLPAPWQEQSPGSLGGNRRPGRPGHFSSGALLTGVLRAFPSCRTGLKSGKAKVCENRSTYFTGHCKICGSERKESEDCMGRPDRLEKTRRRLTAPNHDSQSESKPMDKRSVMALSFLRETKLLVAVMLFGLVVSGCSLISPEAYRNKDEKSTGQRYGLKGLAVVVELDKLPGGSQGISRNQLQTDVETKIRQAGVNVVPQKTMGVLPGTPLVYINVKIAKIEEMYAYNADLICMAASNRPNVRSKLANCNIGTSGLVANLLQVREKVADLVNRFIKDYLTVQKGTPVASFLCSGPSRHALRLTGLLA